MTRQGAAFEEVTLEVGGTFGPKSIFCMRTMNEIMGVEFTLIDYFSSMLLNLHHLKNHTVHNSILLQLNNTREAPLYKSLPARMI